MRKSSPLAGILGLVAGSLLGCSGGAEAGGPSPGGSVTPTAPTSTRSGTAVRPPPDPNNPANPQGAGDGIAPRTRYARLTHRQWENSVRDLLSVDPALNLTADFRGDSIVGVLFDNDSQSLEVDEVLYRAYQASAAKVAEYVTSDPERLTAVMPPVNTGDQPFWDAAQTRAEEFLRVVGAKAFRRPFTDQDMDRFMSVFNNAGGIYEGIGEFESGMRLLIEALLVSPEFTYRIEASKAAQGDVIPLSAFEAAARLSYTLWETLPDASLWQAAVSGEAALEAGASAQAARLLSDPRAADVIGRVHSQLFDSARIASISPAAPAFPLASASLGASAQMERHLFLRDALFTKEGGIKELLTSTQTFVNAELASIYGLSGAFDAAFTSAPLDASQRRGFLTQVAFLASHATSLDPDPIHRGLFVAERLLCRTILAPPVDIPPLPPPGERTNREKVEAHTEQPGTACATCHATSINPFGFPFESFDAIGAYRTVDNGKPVNTATSALLDGQPHAFADALELSQALSNSPQVHACYAKHMLEYAMARPAHALDAGIVERLGAASLSAGLGSKALLAAIVTSQAFLSRSTQELP